MSQRAIRTLIENRRSLTAPPQTTVLHATKLMKKWGEGAVMVIDAGRLTGIFTDRDVVYRVVAEGRDPKITLLSQVMTANPRTTHPDEPFGDTLRMMLEGGFRNVPVVENNRLVGVVSIRDAWSNEINNFTSKFPAGSISLEMLGRDEFRPLPKH